MNYLDELLTPSIAGVQLDRRIPLEFRTEMGTGRLPNSRRSSNENSTEYVHTILSRLFETGLQAA